MTTGKAISIRGLEKRFGHFRLGPLDMEVPRAAIYGLIGPNGAGKTTLIDLMLGIGSADAGEIELMELSPAASEVEIKRRVGYVSPDLNFQAWRRVGRLLEFHRRILPGWDEAYCQRLLGAFDVRREERILDLSFGARIKLGLVLALARRPELLLLDEPTIGLDLVSKQQAVAECLAAVEDFGCTVLISSHGLGDIERIATHLGFLRQGRMILEGRCTDILARFRRVSFRADNGASFGNLEGVFVQAREGERWRVIIDAEGDALSAIKARGGTSIEAFPVELEDVFISMMLAG
jgi:ABC-2 type transport system ATP-binding protein